MTTFWISIVAIVAWTAQAAPAVTPAHRCDWTPPAADREVRVRNVQELQRAVSRLEPGTAILIDDGEYHLTQTLDIQVPRTIIRSRSGDRARVILRGDGMKGPLGVALSVSAPDVTIADVTISDVQHHAIQVRGERGASRVAIHDVHLRDAGQQLLKGSVSGQPTYADDGLVACSRFEYRDTAPSDYTDGIDLIAVRGWVLRDNTFVRIRGPRQDDYRAGPAILVWGNSQDTRIENNVIVESFRGIAIGLVPGTNAFAREGERTYDHQRAIVRNNVICNLEPWADEAIEANASSDFVIEHNTVLTGGQSTTWGIGVRYAATSGLLRNNLGNRAPLQRDGGQADAMGNVWTAAPDWFADAATCDLHLTPAATAAIDAGVPGDDDRHDFDGRPPVGPPDAGAYELGGGWHRGPSR